MIDTTCGAGIRVVRRSSHNLVKISALTGIVHI
jgi:hypothetical protein